MKESAIGIADLTRSVISVPPLAQTNEFEPDIGANRALIDHLVTGGVSTFMYGGNANFYNIPISAYARTLSLLIDLAPADGWIIPALGPDFGRMRDQLEPLIDLKFPTAMVLPAAPESGTISGVMSSLRRAHDRFGKPLMIYAKHPRGLSADNIATLVEDGVAGWVKYAIVEKDPAEDAYLARLVERIGTDRIISGIGERPVLAHFQKFGLRAFTSGSVCLAPALSTAILDALKAGDFDAAARLRADFIPFEDCRDEYGPARVLHDGVTLSGLADMGEIAPLQSSLEGAQREATQQAARDLYAKERAFRAAAA